jgi:hypothetical protein
MSIEEAKNRIIEYNPHADLELVERAYALGSKRPIKEPVPGLR